MEIRKDIFPVIISGIWITISEFLRNEFIFKSYWINHFSSLGLVFKTLPLNGILWMVWGFSLSCVLYRLLQKFSFKEAILLSWIPAFFMMWITIYNLQVLPLELLLFAVPLSLVEIFVAGIIIRKIRKEKLGLS